MNELRSYEDQVAASIQDANASLNKAHSMENLAGQMPASNTVLKLFGVMVVLMLVIGGGVQFMLMSPSLSSEMKRNAMMLFPVVAISLWLGVPLLFMLRRARSKASRVAAVAVHVSCPTCGANNQLVAGDPAAACAYCSSRLVPSPTVMMQVLEAGNVVRREAGMAQLRAKRAVTLSMRNASVNPMKVMLGSWSAVAMLGLGSFVLSAAVEGDHHTMAVAALVMAAMALPVLLFLLWRVMRRERWSSPLHDLEQQFSGRYSTKLEDQVAWLNAYWAETYSDYWIVGAGLRFGTLSATVAGYPMLLDAHPDKPYGGARHAKDYLPRLNILVAAQLPLKASLMRLSAEAEVHVDALRRMGFQLRLSTSGILATADALMLAHLMKQPENLHSLAQTFQSLAHLAS
ncbi:MAG: hypothetical protein AB8H86_27160, partial [Polyangiales bacterium]